MATPLQLARDFRQQLLQQDSAALTRISAAYADTRAALLADLARLLDQRTQAQAAGQATGIGWAYRNQRLQTLLDQVNRQIASFAQGVGGQITTAQQQAILDAQQHATALLGTAGVPLTFNTVPTGAVESLVGTLGDGSPLSAVLDTFGTDAATAAKRALTVGLATGQGPVQTARLLTDALDTTRQRAQLITRTEMLRAYNASALSTYQQHADVVNGWLWMSGLGSRTCPFCISMHGTWHPLTESLDSHPACRCSMLPDTKTAKEMGLSANVPESGVSLQSGSDWFAQQDATVQERILGPSKFAAYRSGAITLDDVRGFGTDPVWGAFGYERSLSAILGPEQAATYTRAS